MHDRSTGLNRIQVQLKSPAKRQLHEPMCLKVIDTVRGARLHPRHVDVPTTRFAMLTALRQLWQVLSPVARRRVWLLALLMVVGTSVESLGIGVVVPVLGTLTNPTWLDRFPSVQSALASCGVDSPVRVVIAAIGLLVFAYMLKTGFAVFLVYVQTRFAFSVKADICVRLYAGYLRQPWTFHLQRNTAELIRNSTVEPQLCVELLLGVLQLASETLVLSALASLIIWYEPVGALVALATMAGAAVAFQTVTRRRIARWGAARQSHEGERLRQLQQGLGGVKEVKLLGSESYLEGRFSRSSWGLTSVELRQQFVGQLPRLWLEAVSILGIATLVITLVWRDASFTATLPTLGLFAAAALRLLPSANRIMVALQSIRYRVYALRTVHSELELVDCSLKLATASGSIDVRTVELESVSYRYPAAHDDALRAVSMSIKAGTTVGLVGPSGAGKSTLVDIIVGLLQPSEGQVKVNGVNIIQNLRGWQNSLGYVPQQVYLVDDTIRRNVAFARDDRDVSDELVWRALDDASIGDFVRSLPAGLNTLTGERGIRLSGGQRQRIGIARALYHNPAVLVLDEATSALDTDTEREVMGAVGALHGRKTVVIIAHRLSTIANCDEVYRVDKGFVTRMSVPEQ